MNVRAGRILKASLLILCFAFAGIPTNGQTGDALEARVDRLFSGYGARTPGVAVAIVRDGKVVLKKGYGAANLEHDVPITTKTVFQIASTSKQFTAFAIYLLEKRGKLSLDDDVRKYVPEVPDLGKTVRVRHLLAHTSGVRDQWSLLTLAGWRMDDVITTPQVLRLVARQRGLNFEPGSAYLYSNSGYTLLAEIVRRVSGQTFAEFTRKAIFEPLGMNDTQFVDDHDKVVRGRADSYELANGVYVRRGVSISAAGATNLYTTAEDMAKWASNFETPLVGDAALIRRFDEPSILNNGERVVSFVSDGEVGYHAKGQNVRFSRGVNVVSHGGHQAGFRSSFWRFPDQRLAFVLLSNDEHFAQLNMAEAIMELCLGDVLKPKPPAPAAAAVGTSERPVEQSSTALRGYEGRFYSEELETAYSARIVGGRLFLSHIRHGDVELTSAGKDRFTGRIEFPVELEFLRDKDARVTGLSISNFGAKNMRFSRLPDPAPSGSE